MVNYNETQGSAHKRQQGDSFGEGRVSEEIRVHRRASRMASTVLPASVSFPVPVFYFIMRWFKKKKRIE